MGASSPTVARLPAKWRDRRRAASADRPPTLSKARIEAHRRGLYPAEDRKRQAGRLSDKFRWGRLRRAGSSPKEILAALRERNAEICDPPLPDKDLVRISNSVGRYLTDARGSENRSVLSRPLIIWLSLEGIYPPPRTWWIQDWLGPWPTLTSGTGRRRQDPTLAGHLSVAIGR